MNKRQRLRGLHGLAAGLLMLAGPQIVQAAQPLWGYGVRTCDDYLAAVEARDQGDAAEYQRYEDWLTGFISGLNLAIGEDSLAGSGIETAMRRTREACEGRGPGVSDFFNAAMELVRNLRSLR
jgi:hypothetical protein